MAEATDSINDSTVQPSVGAPDILICSNCHGNLQEMAPSACGHSYCFSCIMQWLDNMTCTCCTNQLIQNSTFQDWVFKSFIECLPRHAQTLKKHLEMTVDICQKEIKVLKDQIMFREEDFKKETENLLQKISFAQAEIKEKDEMLRETEKRYVNEKNQTGELMEELKKLQQSCKMLEINVEFLKGENQLQKDQLVSLQHIDERCMRLEEKFTEIEEDRRALIGEIGRTSSENQNLIKQLAESKWWSSLKCKRDDGQLKQVLADANENKKRMQENMKSLQNKIDRLTEDLYEKEQEQVFLRHFIIPDH